MKETIVYDIESGIPLSFTSVEYLEEQLVDMFASPHDWIEI